MVQESIFNLISQHDHFSSAQRKRGTVMMPQHAATYQPETGYENATSAPPSSDLHQEGGDYHNQYEQHRPPPTSHQHQGAPRQGGPGPARAPARTNSNAPAEPDSAELARRRQNAEMRGGAMAAALAPELTYQMKMQQSLSVKNHVKDHRQKIKEQSIINGLMKGQGEAPQTRPAARKPEFAGQKAPPAGATGKMDYVERNRTLKQTLDHASKAPTSTNAKAAPVKYKEVSRPKGQIPSYLVERKIEMQISKAMADDAERRKHAGPEAMPEAERVETLRELEKQRDAALREYNLIPPSKHQLHANQVILRGLETKLVEIEKAIDLFNRKVVYIK